MLLIILSTILVTVLSNKPGECEDYLQCKRRDFTTATDSVAKCFGHFGCRRATMDLDGNVCCNGGWSCIKARIRTDANVYCNGIKSCIKPKSVINGKNVACYGPFSCTSRPKRTKKKKWKVKINSIGSTQCDGFASCEYSRITSAATTYCDGPFSCVDATINSQTHVHCDGDSACKRSSITSADTVQCYGKKVCVDATITAPSVRIYGFVGAGGATITASDTVRIHGYKGLIDGTIDSYGVTSPNGMRVEGYGPNALKNAKITCRAGTTCLLVCKGNACKNAYFACEVGANCDVKPAGCQDQYNQVFVTKSDYINCPKWDSNIAPEEMEEKLAAFRNSYEMDDDLIDDDEMTTETLKIAETFESVTAEIDLEADLDDSEDDLIFSEDNALLFGDGGNIIKTVHNDYTIYSHLFTAVLAVIAAFTMVFCYYKRKYNNK